MYIRTYYLTTILIMMILIACGPSEQEQREMARDTLAARNIVYSNERFVKCVAEGDSALAALFIRAGIYPDLIMRNGMTPLMIAAAKGNVPVARLLIHHGADVNTRQPNGATVLDIALLGEQAINPQANTAYLSQPDKDKTARKVKLVEILLKAGAKVELDSYTLLMQSIKSAVEPGGNTRILQMIVDAGANVNQRPVWGKSILMLGVESMLYRPNLEVVRILLEKGADVEDQFINPRNPVERVTALSIARSADFRESVGARLADQLVKLLENSKNKPVNTGVLQK